MFSRVMRHSSKIFFTKKAFLLASPTLGSNQVATLASSSAASFTTYSPILRALQENLATTLSSNKKQTRSYSNHTPREEKPVASTTEHSQAQYKQIAADIDHACFKLLKSYNNLYQRLSARLSFVEVRNHTLYILNMGTSWSLFDQLHQDAAKIIEENVDSELGKLAQKVLNFVHRMALYEKEGIEIAILRQRILTEHISDVTDDWEKRLMALSDNQLLTDNAIVALFNINSMLRKYYIQLHEKKPLLNNEWSLIFQEPPRTWELDDNAIREIEKIKGLGASKEGELAEDSQKTSNEKILYNARHPYIYFLKTLWQNARSNMPVSTASIRKYSKDEMWQIITWDSDTFHNAIVRKIDPELGDIAKLLVVKVKHLADLESNGRFSCILGDKIFHDDMTNLTSQWNSRLKILFKEAVISENKIKNPISDEDTAIYNINLMIEKYYDALHKLIEPEMSTDNSSYLMP